jgi:hypothetical protein
MWKRKQLGTPFCGPKIKANFRNFLPNPSAEEKKTWNSVCGTEIEAKLSEFPSEPFSRRENNLEFLSVEQK